MPNQVHGVPIISNNPLLLQMRFHLVLSQPKPRQSRPCFQQVAGTQAAGVLVHGRHKADPAITVYRGNETGSEAS